LPKAGDALIWHAQVIHGGTPIRDPNRTRKSLVVHYFRSCDFHPASSVEFRPGRYYFKRGHPEVERPEESPKQAVEV
jgi:hypothetical protein